MILRVGVVGLGNHGKLLLERFRRLDNRYVVTTVLSRRPDAAVAFGLPTLTDERAFYGSDLDLVAVATPNHTHSSHLELALRSGKRCFVEKPMVSSAEEVAALRAFPDEVLGRVYVGHNVRRRPVFRKLKELLATAGLGKIVNVSLNYSHGGIHHVPKENWRHSRELHREGALSTAGVHYLDLIHSLFGPAKNVYAILGSYAGLSDAFDANLVVGELANEATYSLQSNYCQCSEQWLTVTGTDGTLYVERDRLSLRQGRDQDKRPSERKLVFTGEERDTIEDQLVELHRAVQGECAFETGFQAGADAVLFLDAAYQSSIRRAPVALSEYPGYFARTR